MKLRGITIFLFVIGIWGAHASGVDTLMVKSRSMEKEVSNVVILPKDYSENKKPYPVLYLLHGANGDYKTWVTRAPKIKEYADFYDIIIVCPDGGRTSWYFDSPIDPSFKYETYVTNELVKAIDEKYNTSAKRESRAISGLSMGGHGAFYLSFKHQEIYGAAGSISGGVDLRPFPTNWDISKRLGDYAMNQTYWETNSVINMVHLVKDKGLRLIFDCGIDDFFYDANKRLHQKLLERRISHDYIERPGAHNWDYFSNSIKYQIVFFDHFFKGSKRQKTR